MAISCHVILQASCEFPDSRFSPFSTWLRDFADLNSKRWATADVKNQMRTHRIRQYVLHRYPACTGSLTLQLFSYDFNSKYSTKQKTPPTKHVKKKNRWLNGPLEGHSLWYRDLKTHCREAYFICTHKWPKRNVYCASSDGSSHNFPSLFSIERKVAVFSRNSKWGTNMDAELQFWFANEQ